MNMAAISFSLAIIQDRDDEGEAPVKTRKFQMTHYRALRAIDQRKRATEDAPELDRMLTPMRATSDGPSYQKEQERRDL